MTPFISDQERSRYAWFFLIEAAFRKIPVSSEALLFAFGIKDEDLQIFSNICNAASLPDICSWVGGQGSTKSISELLKHKLTHNVAKFPPMTVEESPKYNFLATKYWCFVYPPDQLVQKCTFAFEFWESLSLNILTGSLLDELSDFCFKINEVSLESAKTNPKQRRNLATAKTRDWKEILQFLQFTSEHAYLVIYQRDFSETLGNLHELEAYYLEVQSTIENQKGRAKELIDNVRSDLEKKTKDAISLSEARAGELVEEAKKRYPENLLAGYVKQFYSDADAYRKVAVIWLIALTASLALTVFIAATFLGKFSFKAIANPGNILSDLITAVSTIGIWTVIAILPILAALYIAKNPKKLFDLVDLSVPNIDSFFQKLKFSLYTATYALPLVVGLYLFTHYFQFEITSPPITATSFIIPNGNSINWAALLASAAPRIILLLLASSITYFCMRMYKIQKHLEATNRYRATALASFQVFVDTMDSTTESQNRKDKLFDELANLIYTPITTGFHEDDKIKAASLANLVASAAGKMSK